MAVAALGAAEAAQVGVDMIVIFIGTAALGAAARIGQIHIALFPDCGVHAVPDHLVGNPDRQGGGEGLIGVEDQDGSGTSLDTGADLLQCVLDTAVAVDLIAEEIGDNNGLGAQEGNDLLEGGFIALDDSVVVQGTAPPVRAADEIGGDAVQEVGAGLIPQAVMSCGGQRVLDHVAGRGLAVGPGDNNDLHAMRNRGENLRGEPEPYDSGDGGATAPCFAQDEPGELPGGDGGNGHDGISFFHIDSYDLLITYMYGLRIQSYGFMWMCLPQRSRGGGRCCARSCGGPPRSRHSACGWC